VQDNQYKPSSQDIMLVLNQLNMMHTTINENFKNMRDDMRRMEDANRVSMQHLEERINTKVDSLGTRVKVLEAAEKENIKITSKHGVGIAGVGALITYGFVELLKRIP